ncbi:hypothetical protein AKO1_005944 [Acrasis kona]|uniref:Uncharacterized protein n=1 Tax=Acrasis kona TaxID=1008807 RepID=A0AAW2YIL4_9EUKA
MLRTLPKNTYILSGRFYVRQYKQTTKHQNIILNKSQKIIARNYTTNQPTIVDQQDDSPDVHKSESVTDVLNNILKTLKTDSFMSQMEEISKTPSDTKNFISKWYATQDLLTKAYNLNIPSSPKGIQDPEKRYAEYKTKVGGLSRDDEDIKLLARSILHFAICHCFSDILHEIDFEKYKREELVHSIFMKSLEVLKSDGYVDQVRSLGQNLPESFQEKLKIIRPIVVTSQVECLNVPEEKCPSEFISFRYYFDEYVCGVAYYDNNVIHETGVAHKLIVEALGEGAKRSGKALPRGKRYLLIYVGFTVLIGLAWLAYKQSLPKKRGTPNGHKEIENVDQILQMYKDKK